MSFRPNAYSYCLVIQGWRSYYLWRYRLWW